ncbi:MULTISPECIES: ABC transporter substrate-binding protein [Bacillus]|uniref:ABC transporter substrate-binding protein n=1 Tax=Bacillus TaxID=1386 RepID=UPI0003186C43|nr:MULTISPECIES: ABC transporter substrate-binding protein [Bacillus]
MDGSLLILWQSGMQGEIKIDDIAQQIGYSTKQTKRKLIKWSEEGWLTFTSGKGRGKKSELCWLKSVEEEYEKSILIDMDQNKIEQVSKYLLLNWSIETKQRLINAFQSKFGFQSQNEDCLIIPKYHTALTTHPLKAADVNSANLIANIYNRLVALHEDGTISPEIAYSWEYTKTALTLYIRKDVMFHDGSILTAEDVVTSLKRMMQNDHFSFLWTPIAKIFSPVTRVVTLEFPAGCTYVLHLLSLITSSIFKEVNGNLYGTGGFYLANHTNEKTVLSAFPQYFGVRPLLDRVEFIKVPRDFEILYHSSEELKPIDTGQIESDSGFGIVVMNPYRESDMKRKEVRDYIHAIIAKHRDELANEDNRTMGNHEGCLIGYSKRLMPPKLHKPELTEPILLKYANYAMDTTMWFKRLLEQYGFVVQIEKVSFDQMINDSDPLHDADLFIHGEIFELNQSFSYFYFLTNKFSPLHPFTKREVYIKDKLSLYSQTSFEEWMSIHLAIENYLQKQSLCVPLYYQKRFIPFSLNVMNVQIKHFGYVDLTELWIKSLPETSK